MVITYTLFIRNMFRIKWIHSIFFISTTHFGGRVTGAYEKRPGAKWPWCLFLILVLRPGEARVKWCLFRFSFIKSTFFNIFSKNFFLLDSWDQCGHYFLSKNPKNFFFQVFYFFLFIRGDGRKWRCVSGGLK